MAVSKLPALARPIYQPPVFLCACGCGAYADRGFPGGIWYLTAHVPPPMRFPWERGYVADPVTSAAAAAASQAAQTLPRAALARNRLEPDLLSGLAPA